MPTNGLLVVALLVAHHAAAAPLLGASSSYQVDGSAVRVVAADIDQMHGLDLVTGNDAGEDGPSISVLLNTGQGKFSPEVRTTLNPSLFLLHTIAAGDFNGDGASDVAVAVDSIRDFPIFTEALVYLSSGDGHFVSPVEYPLNGLFPQCLTAADVTGDGVLDLVVCHSVRNGGGLVTVLTGQTVDGSPNGSFDSGIDFPVGISPTQIAVADVDGDTHPDVVVGDPAEAQVLILYGTGSSPLLSAPVALADVASPSAVVVANIPGSALPAVLVTSLSAAQLRIFRQSSPRVFQAATSLQLGEGPSDMGVADFNEDHVTDLAVLGSVAGEVQLWLGSPDGNFALGESDSVDPNANSIVVADLNGDLKPDVATTSLVTDQVVVALNGIDVPPTPTPGGSATATATPAVPVATATPTRTPTSAGTPTRTATRTPVLTPTFTVTPGPPGDANCDGRIDGADVGAVIEQIFSPTCMSADANSDDRVTAADLVLIIEALGSSE